MPTRDDHLDHEDFTPKARRDEQSRRFPISIVVVLACVALVIAATGFVLVSRNRQAAEQARLALAERDAAVAEANGPIAVGMEEQFVTPEKRRTNWDKVIGTWVREPGPHERGGHPYRFEFRDDRTAVTIRTNFDGTPQRQEGRVEVLVDQTDSLILKMEVPGGTISYTFQLRPDATLLLDPGMGDFRFTRAK